MSIFKNLARVRRARGEMERARVGLAAPATALLERSYAYPLTTLGVVAGAGAVMGRLDVHPLRVPGLGGLLSGGVGELVAHGVRWLAEAGLGASDPT
jgi:hypothetical protein